MMGRWKAGFLALMTGAMVFAQSALAAAGIAGTYVGVFEHENTGFDQLAKLDLIVSRESGNDVRMSGILTLHFGDFAADETVSYHFDDVRYNLLTNQLVFDSVDQDMTLRTSSVRAGAMELTLRSIVSGYVGTLRLEKDGVAAPQRALMPPVQGEYKGTCEGKERYLYIYTRRSADESDLAGNPFGEYRITGRYGHFQRSLCPNARRTPCVFNEIPEGSYNFLDNQLILAGKQDTMSCGFTETGVQCGECRLERFSDELDGPLAMAPVRHESSFDGAIPDDGPVLDPEDPVLGVEGDYKGYFHHERLDLYQYGAVNILTYPDPAGGGALRMSAAARLSFGGKDSPEVLTYRFQPKDYDILGQTFTFENPSDEVDVILQVESLRQGTMTGIWYSRHHGRIGTFKLMRDGDLDLPDGTAVMKSLGGHYESETFTMEVGVHRGPNGAGSANPYAPLSIGGWIWYKSGIAPRIVFTGGTYDFFTGKIALETSDGRRPAVGLRDGADDSIRARWPAGRFATMMQPANWENFRKADDDPETATGEDVEDLERGTYVYELPSYPASQEPRVCREEAERLGRELARLTGIQLIGAECRDDVLNGLTISIHYGGRKLLDMRDVTTYEDGLYQGYATAEACREDLARQTDLFRTQTRLRILAAYCSTDGHRLMIHGVGAAARTPRAIREHVDGPFGRQVLIEDPEGLSRSIHESLAASGVAVARAQIRDEEMFLHYYGPHLSLEFVRDSAYFTKEECEREKARFAQILAQFGGRTVVQFCAANEIHPLPFHALYTLVSSRSGTFFFQIDNLYGYVAPGTYPTLADCNENRAGESARLSRLGWTVHDSYCRLTDEDEPTYEIKFLRSGGR